MAGPELEVSRYCKGETDRESAKEDCKQEAVVAFLSEALKVHEAGARFDTECILLKT